MEDIRKEIESWKRDILQRQEELARELLEVECISKRYERRSLRRDKRYLKLISKSRLQFY